MAFNLGEAWAMGVAHMLYALERKIEFIPARLET